MWEYSSHHALGLQSMDWPIGQLHDVIVKCSRSNLRYTQAQMYTSFKPASFEPNWKAISACMGLQAADLRPYKPLINI